MPDSRHLVRVGRAGALLCAAVVIGATGCSSSTPTTPAAGTNAPPRTADVLPPGSRFVDANGVDLTGDWSSTERTYYALDDAGQGSETLTISEQSGPLFRVERDLTLEAPYDLGSGSVPAVSVVDQQALGAVNVDGSISIVKTGDGGRLDGWLVDRNTMVLTYTEPGGEPAVARITYRRSAGTPSSTRTPPTT